MQKTRRSILEYLRQHDTGTVDALARQVGLAPVTVRHHLGVLRRNGLVRSAPEPGGRGRPRHVFWLEPRGAELVTEDRYAVLAARLLDGLKAENGRLIRSVIGGMVGEVARGLSPRYVDQPIEVRLELAVRLLRQEGYTVRWAQSNGEHLVRSIGCPYRTLGQDHPELCTFARELLATVTGMAVVHEHRCRNGAAECVFRASAPRVMEDTDVGE